MSMFKCRNRRYLLAVCTSCIACKHSHILPRHAVIINLNNQYPISIYVCVVPALLMTRKTTQQVWFWTIIRDIDEDSKIWFWFDSGFFILESASLIVTSNINLVKPSPIKNCIFSRLSLVAKIIKIRRWKSSFFTQNKLFVDMISII